MLIRLGTSMASPYKSLYIWVKHFFGYLVYETFRWPESWRGSSHIYLLSFPRFWTLSIERFWFWFWSEWHDTENQQYDWRQFMNAAKIRPDLRFMHMHSQVSKHRFGDFFPLLSLSLRCSISQMTKMCFPFLFFFKMTIIRVIFSWLYCWTIKIWLLIFLATGKSGVLFQGRYFFEARSIFWGNVCFWSWSITEYKKHFVFPYCRWTAGLPCFWILHPSHAINRCWKCFDYLECDSYCQHYDNQGWIYWRANGAEMFHISVFKYLGSGISSQQGFASCVQGVSDFFYELQYKLAWWTYMYFFSFLAVCVMPYRPY